MAHRRIVFMGTPGFALPSLQALVQSGRPVVAVVTQPDRPKGRGRKVTPPPVKEMARHLGIPVLQPESLRDPAFLETLTSLDLDYIIVVAYGKILPPEVLKIPQKACINLHASLLPKYRGASPIQWAIIHGERVTGLTTILMDEGIDTGHILLQTQVRIDPEDTGGMLSERLAWIGAGLLRKTLEEWEAGRITPRPQPEEGAFKIPPIRKEDGRIQWEQRAFRIHNLIRALDPRPGAFTYYKGEKWNLWKTEVVEKPFTGRRPGEIVDVKKDFFVVATGEGGLRVREIQPAGRRRMTVEEYLRGNSIEKGMILTPFPREGAGDQTEST